MDKASFRVNVGEWWFRSGGAGWYPGLYEWFFSRTRRGGALRTREVEIVYGMLSNVLEPDHSIVEFGSGTGSYAVPLARRRDRTVAVAVSGGERVARGASSPRGDFERGGPVRAPRCCDRTLS